MFSCALANVAEFAASIPFLMGVHPGTGVYIAGTTSGHLTLFLQSETESPQDIEENTAIVRHVEPHQVYVVAIGAQPESTDVQRYSAVADVVAVTDSTQAGAQYRTLDGGVGVLPDMRVSVLAACCAVAGQVIYSDPASLRAATLPDPGDVDAVRRRERLLSEQAPYWTDSMTPLLGLPAQSTPHLPRSDADFVETGFGLLAPRGLAHALHATLRAPQDMHHRWIACVRGLPQPWRTPAAVLSTLSLLLGEHGTLALIGAVSDHIDCCIELDDLDTGLDDLVLTAVAEGTPAAELAAAVHAIATRLDSDDQ